MGQNVGNLAVAGTRVLARDAELAVEDCVCAMHARSPAVERMHPRVAVAVMLRGAFHVRAREGEALLGPGALLLKNGGATHTYRHVDDGGDRTITFEYEEAFVESVRASYSPARRGHRAFDRLAIPASPATAAAVALVERARGAHELHEAALAIAAIAFGIDWGPARRLAEPSLAQTRRVARVLRYIDAHCAEDCSLAALAAHAGLSSFHFARVFHALAGQTPRRYVIATRLRAAAAALCATRKPVTEVALDAGFGDLSHFMTSFRRAFGVSPRRYRVSRFTALRGTRSDPRAPRP